jgi:hypothetical protein
MCDHAGFHTPESRYDRHAELLRAYEVCDDCGESLRELWSQAYLPAPISSSSAASSLSFSARVP